MNLIQMTIILITVGKNPLENEVALIINKSTKCSTSVQSHKQQNNLCFQCKSFIITVMQVFALITNAEEAEVERFYEDLQDLLKVTPKKKKKRCPFHHGGLQCKSRKRYLE